MYLHGARAAGGGGVKGGREELGERVKTIMARVLKGEGPYKNWEKELLVLHVRDVCYNINNV